MYARAVTRCMASKKGRTGSAGRFGARYGRVARRRVAEIESDTRNASVDGDDVSRVGTGIWVNEETGEKFAGGAYRPRTDAGRTVVRSIRTALAESEADEERRERQAAAAEDSDA